MILVLVILFVYVLLIGAFLVGFNKVEDFELNETKPVHAFSIVIAFRNEVENLPKLLVSLVQLKYPATMFEIILVNDNSSDDFIPIINDFQQNNSIQIQILNSPGVSSSPKKEALFLGISAAKNGYIVTTDADCKVPKNWLMGFNQLIIQKGIDFIAGAVVYVDQSTFLNQFQQLNLASLLGSTIGSFGLKRPIMCNAANLCYSKKVFKELKGFEGNESIASGDDIFLLEKMQAQFPNKISYLKSAELIVETNSEPSWRSFINQQQRWASKTTSYKNNWAKSIGLLVLLANASLLFLLVFSLFQPSFIRVLVLFFGVKIFFDGMLLFKTIHQFNKKILVNNFVISLFVHPIFTVVVAFMALFKSYHWKNRQFIR